MPPYTWIAVSETVRAARVDDEAVEIDIVEWAHNGCHIKSETRQEMAWHLEGTVMARHEDDSFALEDQLEGLIKIAKLNVPAPGEGV